MLRQMFHPCTENFILGTCRGRCCEGAKGISVVVHPSEKKRIEKLGATVVDGYIVPDARGLCPFKSDDGRCTVHLHKPMGCKASPFTFNSTGLLIVRNRYRLLKCYKCPGAVPAYEAHRWSLGQIFMEEEANIICEKAKRGDDFITAWMPVMVYVMLNDNHHHRNSPKEAAPE